MTEAGGGNLALRLDQPGQAAAGGQAHSDGTLGGIDYQFGAGADIAHADADSAAISGHQHGIASAAAQRHRHRTARGFVYCDAHSFRQRCQQRVAAVEQAIGGGTARLGAAQFVADPRQPRGDGVDLGRRRRQRAANIGVEPGKIVAECGKAARRLVGAIEADGARRVLGRRGGKIDPGIEKAAEPRVERAAGDAVLNAQWQQKSIQQAISTAVGTLPEREAMMLQLYFVEALSLEEIGQVLGVGAARVCQIKKAALGKLRERLGG